ncbi:MAG: NUDIX hydrolase [Patescibacteria group bacterium]
MTTFSWHTQPVPDGMRIRQVYGFCFDTHGRLLMRSEGAKHSLPGGRPEADEDLAATLTRECYEEVHAVIKRPVYLGYQQVDDQNGEPPYAQVRMVALIAEIREARPDPDTGRTYGRLLTSAARAGELLDWGELGRIQSSAAAIVAATKFGVPAMNPGRESQI